MAVDDVHDTRKSRNVIFARNAAANIPSSRNAQPWKAGSARAVAPADALCTSKRFSRIHRLTQPGKATVPRTILAIRERISLATSDLSSGERCQVAKPASGARKPSRGLAEDDRPRLPP